MAAPEGEEMKSQGCDYLAPPGFWELGFRNMVTAVNDVLLQWVALGHCLPLSEPPTQLQPVSLLRLSPPGPQVFSGTDSERKGRERERETESWYLREA